MGQKERIDLWVPAEQVWIYDWCDRSDYVFHNIYFACRLEKVCAMRNGTLSHHKDYLIGFLIISGVGAVVNAFNASTFNFVVDVLIGVVFFLLLSMLVGGLVSCAIWLVKKDFVFERFIKISVVVCLIMTLMHIVHLIFNFR